MFNRLFIFGFILLLFLGCATKKSAINNNANNASINSPTKKEVFKLDEKYADNGSKNGNHTIVYFSGNLSTLEEIRNPLLRGFEQANIIADPNDNLVVLFIDSKMAMTLYMSERNYYLSYINGIVTEDEFIQTVYPGFIAQ